MKRFAIIFCATVLAAACTSPRIDLASVADAGDRIDRVEPLSWWVGMETPLQLMVYGKGISECDVAVAGGDAKITCVHKADSPDYLFVDVAVSPRAEAGTYYLVFSRDGERFKYAYEIAGRREGTRDRGSFTTADMIYLLMPDRFANGDESNDTCAETKEPCARNEFFGRHGGDIAGMDAHLDYIADLGATAVWATPLLLDDDPDGSYHGYACADYYNIDPRFGSNGQYRDFVRNAHSRGLKVIMDVVPNHCGIGHWWLDNLPFEDWIHRFDEYTPSNIAFSTNMDINASKRDLMLQESGWFVPTMPDMNLDNDFVRRYFEQWAVWWIEYADLDGLRVDTYPYNEKMPMSEWCAAVRREYPNINIVGECWTSSIPQLAYWQSGNANKDGFDSHLPSIMDFPLREAVCKAMNEDKPNWGEGMTRVYDCVSHDFVYHDLSNMLVFFANHDTDRIADVVNGNPRRMKLTMAMLATMRGIPQIFSGDEMMFRSKDLSQGHGGLRVDFPGGWRGDKVDLFDPAQRDGVQRDVFDYTRSLFRWRKDKTVIHSGRTMHFLSRDNTYAYFRYDDSDAVFVFINNAPEPRCVPWSNYAEIAASLRDGRIVPTGETCTVDDSTVVAPQSALIVEFKR